MTETYNQNRHETPAKAETYPLSNACSADESCVKIMQTKSSSGQSDPPRTDPISAHTAIKTEDDLTSVNPPLLAKLPAERLQHYLHVRMFQSCLNFPDTGNDCADRNGTASSTASGSLSRNLPHLVEEDMSSSRNITLALQANQEFV
jgi:hypothetical protein